MPMNVLMHIRVALGANRDDNRDGNRDVKLGPPQLPIF
jgi:hypothetical protein